MRENTPRLRISPTGWAVIVLIIVVLLAYGDSIRLPFFFDDLPHYTWLRSKSLVSIFLSAAGRPYYRPMQFFGWKLYETLFGGDSSVIYHIFNLLVHVVNALLVTILARSVTKDHLNQRFAILAGVMFALFPFSYQVVPLPASLTHPMATLFVLLTILAYERFDSTHKFRWLFVSLGLGLLAFASNEGSFLLAGLVGLFALTRLRQPVQWRWLILFVLLAALYYPWYQSRQADHSGTLSIRSAEAIFQNALYVVQGLTFPVQPISEVLVERGMNDQLAVLFGTVLVLIVFGIIFIKSQRFSDLVLGIGWYTFCLAPEILLLSHNYLINAPRVMYLGSVGVAWLWANAAQSVWNYGGNMLIYKAAAIAIIVAVLIPAFVFVRQRIDLYTLNAQPLQASIDVANQASPNDRLLFVNLPAWVSSTHNWFPIGHEGVLFLPAYSSMANYLAVNLDRAVQAKAVEFDNLSVPQPYYYGIYGPSLDWEQLVTEIRSADQIYFADYAPDSINLVSVGKLSKSADVSANTVAQFGNSLVLQKMTWSICDKHLQVSLTWHAFSNLPSTAHIFVHLLNLDGTLAAQHDSPPLMGLFPFWQWQVGDTVEDMHPIDLTTLVDRQKYALEIGLYDSDTGQRLPAVLPDGSRPDNNAVRIGSFTWNQSTQNCLSK